jgi:hypothetical protein
LFCLHSKMPRMVKRATNVVTWLGIIFALLIPSGNI